MSVSAASALTLARAEGGRSRIPHRAHTGLAALALFIGLSAANAMGGVLQVVFFGICLSALLTKPHRVPLSLLVSVMLCGFIATLTGLRGESGFAPFLRFARPFVEGYLLAVMLSKFCGVRSKESLMMALAFYIAIEMLSGALMAIFPDLRFALLDKWYADDSYGGQAFQNALLFRGFGVSRHHLFGLPLAIGTIASLLLISAISERSSLRRWVLVGAAFAGMLLILPNARIGLVPVFICYALGISVFFHSAYLRQLAFLSVAAPLLLMLLKVYLGEAGDMIVDWLVEGSHQFIDSSQGAEATTFNDLAGMVIFPTDPLVWLIGDGSVCQPGEICYSDIGWVRLLQEGGLILAIPVTALYVRLLWKIQAGLCIFGENGSIREVGPARRQLFCVLLFTFLLATTKGEAYAANDYSRLLMTLGVLLHQLPRRARASHAKTRTTAPLSLPTLQT